MDYNGDGLTLCIDGPGGSYAEALLIVDALAEFRIWTVVPSQAQCLSACAVAFMGGTYVDEASLMPLRQLMPGADLGFHAPSITLSGTGSMPVQMVSAAYETALADIHGVVSKLLVNAAPAHEASMSPSLLARMLATPPGEMFHVTTLDEIGRWRIQFWDGPENSINFSSANLIQACQNLFAWRNDHKSHSTRDYSIEGGIADVLIEQQTNTNPYSDAVIWKYSLTNRMYETECTFHVPPDLKRITDGAIRVDVYSMDDLRTSVFAPPTWAYLNPEMTLAEAAARAGGVK